MWKLGHNGKLGHWYGNLWQIRELGHIRKFCEKGKLGHKRKTWAQKENLDIKERKILTHRNWIRIKDGGLRIKDFGLRILDWGLRILD